MEFTDDSILLMQNWQTVEDIQEATVRLEKEMISFLQSLGLEAESSSWWSDEWHFVDLTPKRPTVAVATSRWRRDDRYVIEIGVDDFTPDRALGSADTPFLYVWVEEEGYDLVESLMAKIGQMPGETLGELDHKRNHYAVKQPVQKCPPGGDVDYFEAVMAQTLDFFEHYASVMLELDDVIREHLAGNGE